MPREPRERAATRDDDGKPGAVDTDAAREGALPEGGREWASPTSASSKEGKIRIIRSSSGNNLGKRLTRPRQMVLLGVALAVTAHSVYFLSARLGPRAPLFDLHKAPLHDAIGVVWSSGWITAASTGLGAIPFVLVNELSPRLVAVCNAVAAGMMMAAALGLVVEGCLEETAPDTMSTPIWRVLLGLYLGVGFVKLSSHVVGDEVDPAEVLDDMSRSKSRDIDTKRAMVIMAVMTLHSFTEGVGIGVSYHSQSLGGFISATLAVHNVPEGIAVAIVLIPRGFGVLATTLWCIFSSLPQPLMAVPAYLFVDYFRFVTPVGFGFSAGAMAFVSLFELLSEARERLSAREAYSIMALAMTVMGLTQAFLREKTM
ncbi:Zinc transporter ZIP11 [Hondaea fermentalgiana]|uniref:Zinc transporter ZIP11 n=1 Tax=Hondaea fermentalgiana TaxID=2315210 RepID=A0A2R5GPP3_9STRA|nr:Zinc transporter ZIP11 [Hondaea fermentalgiana]|eukprot:GBG32830.1 Zinc transporter ZIP11 [Hondaea fermentalgiana]